MLFNLFYNTNNYRYGPHEHQVVRSLRLCSQNRRRCVASGIRPIGIKKHKTQITYHIIFYFGIFKHIIRGNIRNTSRLTKTCAFENLNITWDQFLISMH